MEADAYFCVYLCVSGPPKCLYVNKHLFFLKRNSEQRQSDLWNIMKNTYTHTMGISEGEKRNKVAEKICEEIMSENVPNLMKDMNLHI